MKGALVFLLLVCLCSQVFAGVLSDLVGVGSTLLDIATSGVSDDKKAKDQGSDSLAGILTSEDPKAVVKREARKLSLTMNESQLQTYYQENKLNLWGPLALGVFLGFGSGQRIMGDYKGSAWITPIEVIGVTGAGAAGIVYFISYLCIAPWSSMGNRSDYTLKEFSESQYGKTCIYIMLGGLAVGILDRVIAGIRVLTWGSSYNKNLREGLGLNRQLKLAAAPFISEDNQLGFYMGADISF